MPADMDYSSTIKSHPLLFVELKNLCRLHLTGLKDSELREKIVHDNLFQTDTLTRRVDLAPVVLKRLHILDEFLMEKLATSDLETGRIIALYALMKTNRLFREFMIEVVADKLATKDFQLVDADFDHFFERKRQQSTKVESWKPYTLYKIKQVIIRILRESDFLKHENDGNKLIRPMTDPDVSAHLADIGQPEITAALVGV